MTTYETATLPGVAASISDRGRGPVVGAANRSRTIVGAGLTSDGSPSCCDPVWPLWHVEAAALPAAFGVGAAFRWELLSGHVEIDTCPHWHPGKITECEHFEDMQRVAVARERLRELGASGVRP